MRKPVTITNDPAEHLAMDFFALRKEGIKHIQKLAGNIWTDYNAHDPGVTILEQLCYAITDLGYRINFDIQDLLSSGKENPYPDFFSPAQILGTNPVTLTDLRKLLIDVEGVKNAWIEPVSQGTSLYYDENTRQILTEPSGFAEKVELRGLFNVIIERSEAIDRDRDELLTEVNATLHAARSLCEDFEEVNIPKPQSVFVVADIEIGDVDNVSHLLGQIQHKIASHISPQIRFHTLQEMLDKGKSIDEIFDGPILKHGFVETEDLKKIKRKTQVRASDIIQEIMDVEGVLAIRKITLAKGSNPVDWVLEIDDGHIPYFDPKSSKINLVKNQLKAGIDTDEVEKVFNELQFNDISSSIKVLEATERDIVLEPRTPRNLETYHSIQYQFPQNYGITENGLPDNASEERKAQAKQLKSYLLLFEQILASYFSQIQNFKHLFSFQESKMTTYFTQLPQSVPGYESLINGSVEDHKTKIDSINESIFDNSERKNRFLNHLLARFAEDFTDYALILLNLVAGNPEGRVNLAESKTNFLKHYPEISGGRGSGIDYSKAKWGGNEVSGLKKRVSLKLGISDFSLNELEGQNSPGFHVVEHILLRPGKVKLPGDFKSQSDLGNILMANVKIKDPFSLRVSFVFPNWVPSFAQKEYKDFIRNVVREETPAHIIPHIHWFGKAKMKSFETSYKNWIEGLNHQT